MSYSRLFQKLIFMLLFSLAVPVAALETPSGVNIIPTYAPILNPVLGASAATSKPISLGNVAEGGNTFKVKVQLEALDSPVDLYFALFFPKLVPSTVFFLNDAGGIVPFSGVLPPWKRNVSNAVDEIVLPDIPVSFLPGGDYFFFLLLTPTGSSGAAIENLYLWSSVLTLTPTADEFANALVDQLGADVNSVVALLQGFDNGYSLQQIVDAVFAGRFTADGTVLDANGALVAPAATPLGLILSNTSAKALKELSTVTWDALAKAVHAAENAGGYEGEGNRRRGIAYLIEAIVLLKEKKVPEEEIFEALLMGFILIAGDSCVTLTDADGMPLGAGCTCIPPMAKQARADSPPPVCVFNQPIVSSDNTTPTGTDPTGPTDETEVPKFPEDFSQVGGIEVHTNIVVINEYENPSDPSNATFRNDLFYSGILAFGGIQPDSLVQNFSRYPSDAQSGNVSITLNAAGDAITAVNVVHHWDATMTTRYVGAGQIPFVYQRKRGFIYTLKGQAACDFFTVITENVTDGLNGGSHTIGIEDCADAEFSITLRTDVAAP